jgi:hypothetical protein
MTVAQLIEALKALPQDQDVVIKGKCDNPEEPSGVYEKHLSANGLAFARAGEAGATPVVLIW